MASHAQLIDRVAALEHRLANLNPVGRVMERDHEKGVRLNFGTDEKPFLSPWIQPGDRTGASRYLPEVGEQVMALSHGGDWQQATLMPLTHSDKKKNPADDADETVHHNRDGQRSSVRKGHVKNAAKNKHSKWVGGKEDEPRGGSNGKPAHELNKQLQGIKAHLTQHDHNIAGLHDATSKFREIVQQFIPPVAAVQPLLSGDAQSLDAAVQGVTGKLEGYVAKSLQNMIGKLANGFMGNAMALVQGFVGGDLGGMLDQVASLASANGLEGAMGGLIDQARGEIESAAGGATGALAGHLDGMGAAVAGTPAEAAFGALKAQILGKLGAIGGLMGGLGDLVDHQKNLTQGVTKHYRLGGYDGGDD